MLVSVDRKGGGVKGNVPISALLVGPFLRREL